MAVKTGRPTKADDEIKKQVIEHLEAGLTVEQTAKLLHIARSSLYKWAKEDSKFSDTINNSKHTTIQEEVRRQFKPKDLIKALGKRATGYEYTEVKTEYDGDGVLIKTTKQKKHMPADPEAIDKLIVLSGENVSEDAENALTINFVRRDTTNATGC